MLINIDNFHLMLYALLERSQEEGLAGEVSNLILYHYTGHGPHQWIWTSVGSVSCGGCGIGGGKFATKFWTIDQLLE